jgi:hypothetical protein
MKININKMIKNMAKGQPPAIAVANMVKDSAVSEIKKDIRKGVKKVIKGGK